MLKTICVGEVVVEMQNCNQQNDKMQKRYHNLNVLIKKTNENVLV